MGHCLSSSCLWFGGGGGGGQIQASGQLTKIQDRMIFGWKEIM